MSATREFIPRRWSETAFSTASTPPVNAVVDRAAVLELDPEQPIHRVRTMPDYLRAPLFLLLVAGLAILVPARRATTVDPVRVLQVE